MKVFNFKINSATLLITGLFLIVLPIAGVHSQGLSAPSVATRTPSGPRVVEVEIAQRLLGRLGLLDEQATGVMSQGTEDALRRFAMQNNLPVTAQLNESLLSAMRAVAWNSGAWKKGMIKGQDKLLDASGVREAQSYLVKLGFNPGPIDGTFGPHTQSSLETFQANQKTSVDGLVTKTSLMNLKRAVLLPAASAVGILRVLNWPDYIDPQVLEDFEKETKTQIIYDTYGSNEELELKLKNSPEPYDVVVPTANNLTALTDKGLLKPLNKSALSNLGNLDPGVLAYLDGWDKGATYSVPYMWFTLGIAANPKLVAKFAPNAKLDSLASIFDPETARKLSGCGVRIVDSAADVVPIAALYGGLKSWSNDAQSVSVADKVLMNVKNFVQPVPSDEYISALAEGKICIALGFSGDTIQARKDATASGNVIQYRVPIDGSSLGFDTLTIPANAKNTIAALKFIDFILRPEVIAKISNVVRYANANAKSGPFIDKVLLTDPGIYPPPTVMSRLWVVPSLDESTKKLIEQTWSKFSAK
jgi:spermidine/putrescine-binding protein